MQLEKTVVGEWRALTAGSAKAPPIVLVHGWGAEAATWDTHVHLLAERFRVVVPDLLGADIPSVVDGLAAVVRVLTRAPAVLVGHSMGGQVVARLARDHPELVRAIAVIDPAYGADDDELADAPARLADLERRGVQAAAEFVDRAFGGLRSEHWRVTRSRMLAADGAVLAGLYSSMYLDEDSIGGRRAAARCLAHVRVPLLGLYSAEPPSRWAASVSPRSRVVVWPGTSHYLHEERPQEFCDLLAGWIETL